MASGVSPIRAFSIAKEHTMKKFFSALAALALTVTLSAPAASALELEDAKTLLSQLYYNGVPEEVLELDSLDEILAALGDPYTYYMNPEQYESFYQAVNGQEVVGIGITVENAFHNGFLILSVLPDSPAQQAGLQAGDRLIAVDGVPLTADTDPRVPISGAADTSVTVTVVRDSQELSFTMIRQAVSLPIVTYALEDGVAVIDCVSFGTTTSETFQKALEELEDQTAVWIVDLRANPGGDSKSTAGSASFFTGGGIMLYFRDGAGNYNYTYTSPNYPDLTDKPVIVLTSEHSASGSELFSGIIRDYQAGIALGQRTFGKGTAQIVLTSKNTDMLSEGEALRITIYRFFSPEGVTNHIVGVLPTLVLSPENTETAALLLGSDKPQRAEGYAKLELAGQTFYLDLAKAVEPENQAAFTELLEALPPAAALSQGSGTQVWTTVTPAQMAQNLQLSFTPRTFSDTQLSLYTREIDTLAAYGLLTGDENGAFHPGDILTRGDFCAMAAQALGLYGGKEMTFSDVPQNAAYAQAISDMASLGFLAGYEDGTFRPDQPLTYEQMITALSAAAVWTDMDSYNLSQAELDMEQWLEYQDFSDWARPAARNLDLLELLLGDTAPGDTVTRELAAGTLCRLMEKLGLIWD